MRDDTPASIARAITYLEQCLGMLEDVVLPSRDLVFLHTFLTHAKAYLSKDVAPDTEAAENWDTPENQAMIKRFITHVAQQIRLIIEDWQQAQAGEASRPLRVKMDEILVGLDRLHTRAEDGA